MDRQFAYNRVVLKERHRFVKLRTAEAGRGKTPFSLEHLELSTSSSSMPPPPASRTTIAHEIDCEIFGHEMQFVEIELDPRESAVSEVGSMMYMSDHILTCTVTDDIEFVGTEVFF